MATAENVWAWSTTAGSNDAADSSIVWTEGQDPGTVNNSARSMMAATKKWANVNSGNVTVGGTADGITVTTGQAISAGHQALGFRICFRAAFANTGAATVAVDGLSAVAIKRPNGDALAAGDIVAGGFFDLAFDGTNYRILGASSGAGAYGSLAGGNTWTGNNSFTGNIQCGDATDAVTIKGQTVSIFGSQMLAGASASAWRTGIGLGTAATQNTGTSGANIPLLNGSNNWSDGNTFRRDGGGTATNAVVNVQRTDASAGASAFYLMTFYGASELGGSITTTVGPVGGTSVAYNETSDERLKYAQTPLVDSGAVIDQLAPIRFRWGSDTGREDFGFSAQALHAVVPQAVTPGEGNPGEPGFIPWQKTVGRLEAILVAEIKALRARVAALEAAA